MLTFAYPWLLAVFPLAFAVRWLVPPYRESRQGLRVPFLPRLARIEGREPTEGAVVPSRRWAKSLAIFAAWACFVVALARPQWLEPPISHTVPVRDMMLAVDLSGSMDTKDFRDADGKSVDRLTAVKRVLDDFLTRRKGDRVGLIVFGSAAFVQAPFTQDLDVCRELLDETRVGMAGPKTAFGDAIGLAITVFERSDVPEKLLIVLTDGNDTGSRVPPANAATIAKDRGIQIHTVSVGDPKAAGEDKLDEATLQRVATSTGGTYSHAANRGELETIYARLDAMPTPEAETVSYRPCRELFPWPLTLGFSLTLLVHAITIAAEWVRESRPQPAAHAA